MVIMETWKINTQKSSFGLRKNAAYVIKHDKLEVSVYDKLMRHWIRTELGLDIPCIKEVMEKTCWGCGEEKDALKGCPGKGFFEFLDF